MPKQVYITIDDGPSKDFKDKVDFLSEKNIPAAFFCLGQNLEMYKDDVAYAITKGFLIGNHSFSHKHSLICQLKKENNLYKKLIRLLMKYIRRAG